MKRVIRHCIQLFTAALLAFSLTAPAVTQATKPTAHALLVDNTGSMRTQFEQVIAISKGIVERTTPRGPLAVFTFESGPGKSTLAFVSRRVNWSQNTNVINIHLDELFVLGGRTTLKDAIAQMAEELQAKANLEPDAVGEKMIFVVTDGEDRASKLGEKELITLLKANGIKVFAVGLVAQLDDDPRSLGRSAKTKAMALLEKITKETGGRVVFVNSTATRAAAVLDELFKN